DRGFVVGWRLPAPRPERQDQQESDQGRDDGRPHDHRDMPQGRSFRSLWAAGAAGGPELGLSLSFAAGAGSLAMRGTMGGGSMLSCRRSPPWRRARPSAPSFAGGRRSAGFLACGRETIAHSHSGTSGITSRIGRGVSSATRLRTASVVEARNGGRPLHMTYSTLPRLNRSARWSIAWPRACSGAMYIGVPAMYPLCVRLASSAARARPQAVI